MMVHPVRMFLLFAWIGGVMSFESDGPPLPSSSLQGPESEATDSLEERRRESIRDAFRHAWNSYALYAWGRDELAPAARSGRDWIGVGLTIIDALDTAWIMGLHDEFRQGRAWVERLPPFRAINRSISVFETSIRVLGGLLSCHALTQDPLFLDRAEEMAQTLTRAWRDFPMPAPELFPLRDVAEFPVWSGGQVVLSEVGTFTLEALYLKNHQRDATLWEHASHTVHTLMQHRTPTGLYPILYSVNGRPQLGSRVKWGGHSDSFYEYLLKTPLLGSEDPGDLPALSAMLGTYAELMQAMTSGLVRRLRRPPYYTHTVDLATARDPAASIPEMDHLTCFLGGLWALSAPGMLPPGLSARLHRLSSRIARTCIGAYATPTGLAPEILDFSLGRMQPKWDAVHYLLRPETVEALFYLWRSTHEAQYREAGWRIFRAIEAHCRTSSGYVGLANVTDRASAKIDLQQTYFLSETLKYLYLLFSPESLLPLGDWVFNTEGHPLRKAHSCGAAGIPGPWVPEMIGLRSAERDPGPPVPAARDLANRRA